MRMTDKGTRFEKLLMFKWLRCLYPSIFRWSKSRGPLDIGDYGNIGQRLIEARHRKTWALPEWIRDIERKSAELMDGAPWEIVFAGDRTKAPKGIYVVTPAEQYYRDQLELKLRRAVHPYENYDEALDDMEREDTPPLEGI